VRGGVFPVLWLCGPPGVGKSTVAWKIFTDLLCSGINSGFVDVDQLGICYPEPPADPGRHRMQLENLAAVVDTYRSAGARCVIVSGVVDAEHGVDHDQLRDITLTLCRLRSDRIELTRRLAVRGEVQYDLDAVWREAEALDRGAVVETPIDTTGLTVAEVADRVQQHTGGWPGLRGAASDLLAPTSLSSARVSAGAAGPVLWLCGPTGVGKSAVGFQIFMQQLGAGRAAAFVDLDQVGFCEPAPSDDPARHRVKASNLAALWRTYRTAGAQCLVMVGPAAAESDIKRYTEALPDATFTVGRLHAQPEELTRRIMLRGEGRGWAQPGDPLRGQPTARLLDVARIAIMDDTGLEGAGVGDLRVDTTRLSVREVADTIITAAGWDSVPSCDEGLSGASR